VQDASSPRGALATFSHRGIGYFCGNAAELAARFFAASRRGEQPDTYTDPKACEKGLHGGFLPVVG
jgi:hypothetical protein